MKNIENTVARLEERVNMMYSLVIELKDDIKNLSGKIENRTVENGKQNVMIAQHAEDLEYIKEDFDIVKKEISKMKKQILIAMVALGILIATTALPPSKNLLYDLIKLLIAV